MIGHVLLMFSEVFNKFLSLPHSSIKCKVVGKIINRVAVYGLEVPIDFSFYGYDRAIKWAQKNITSIMEDKNMMK